MKFAFFWIIFFFFTYEICIQGNVKGNIDTAKVKSYVSENTLRIEWHSSAVVFPGFKQPVTSAYLRYRVFALNMDVLSHTTNFKSTSMNYHFSTLCGLDFIKASSPDAMREYLVSIEPTTDSTMQMNLAGLKVGTNYKILVYVECDRYVYWQESSSHIICHLWCPYLVMIITTFHDSIQRVSEADESDSPRGLIGLWGDTGV